MNGWLATLRVLLGDMRRKPGPALATVVSMTAGVAVFVAIWLAGTAARSSFVSAVEAVAGRATHEVTRSGGLDEARFADFAVLAGVEAAEPLLEGVVAVRGLRRGDRLVNEANEAVPPLRLLGIDPFFNGSFAPAGGTAAIVSWDVFRRFVATPGTVVLPRPWAVDAGAEVGDVLTVAARGRAVDLEVIGTYGVDVFGEAARNVCVADLATAQEVLDRVGRLDRVSLIVRQGEEHPVRAALQPGERLERPALRGERVARMVDAFRLNLLALGGLALVVGALLIYNAAQFAVVRRQRLLGRLRCLGASARLVVSVVVAESMVFGLIGGVAGIFAGHLLAHELVGHLAQAVSDLYAFVRVEMAGIAPWTVATILTGACGLAAAAAFLPALDAARTPPRLVGLQSREEDVYRGHLPRLFLRGAGAAVLGVVLLRLPLAAWWPGAAAAFLFVLAGAFFLPPLMALALPPLARLGERLGLLQLPLAAGALHRSLTRTGGAAAALAVALSMTVAILIMVTSYRVEVGQWIRSTLQADIYVSDLGAEAAGEEGRIPADAIAIIRRRPEVRGLAENRFVEVPLGDRSILFKGVDLPVPESTRRFTLLAGDPVTAFASVRAGAVLISEPLANRYGLTAGDTLALPGRDGDARFAIAGVFRDFSVDRGYALTTTPHFLATFGDPGVRTVSVYLKPEADASAVGRALRSAFAGQFLLQLRSNAQLRGRVFEVFDQTFALTHVLQVIATLMALGGIAVTLAGLFLERGREIGTLRSLGAGIRGVWGLAAAESLLMALFPVALSVPLGGVLALVLIDVVNLRSFGWSLGMTWPWGSVLVTCGMAVGAGLVATVIPVWFARRQSIAAAVREE